MCVLTRYSRHHRVGASSAHLLCACPAACPPLLTVDDRVPLSDSFQSPVFSRICELVEKAHSAVEPAALITVSTRVTLTNSKRLSGSLRAAPRLCAAVSLELAVHVEKALDFKCAYCDGCVMGV